MKKNFLNIAMAAVVALGAVAYTGCGKKGCMNDADINYDESATESDPEACNPTGTIQPFVGTFQGTETCGSGTDAYTVTVASSANEYKILVSNLYGVGTSFTLTAEVSKTNLTIPNQTIQGLTVSGNGTLSGSTLTLNYTVSSSAGSDVCSLTAQKQ